jgi:hypothetical protein
MITAVVRESSIGQSKTLRFGFGYEAQSANGPSAQTARAEFLSIVLEKKPGIVLRLFEDCYPPFTQFLEQSAQAIAAIQEEVEANTPTDAYILRQPHVVMERSLKTFLPTSRALETPSTYRTPKRIRISP